MKRHYQFEAQLENLRNEANTAATYLYAEMAIQHAASKSRNLLNRLNNTPTFWNACNGAFQSAAYISLARVFDYKNSKYNIGKLLDSVESDLHLFQRDALADRKRGSGLANLDWIDEYLSKAYYPTQKDVTKLRKKVDAYRVIYERAVKPVRNEYLAHRVKQEHAEVSALYGGGTIKDLWRLTTFLLQLHSVLWDMFQNGRKPVFRPIRYSVKTIFDAKTQRSGAHETIIRDVKKLMSFIENTIPNTSIK